jgi:hypothetical protein
MNHEVYEKIASHEKKYLTANLEILSSVQNMIKLPCLDLESLGKILYNEKEVKRQKNKIEDKIFEMLEKERYELGSIKELLDMIKLNLELFRTAKTFISVAKHINKSFKKERPLDEKSIEISGTILDIYKTYISSLLENLPFTLENSSKFIAEKRESQLTHKIIENEISRIRDSSPAEISAELPNLYLYMDFAAENLKSAKDKDK